MIVFDGKVYPSLAESRWAKSQTNPISGISTLPTDNTVGPKRRIWEDADVEVGKRQCRNYFPLIGPIRIIKTHAGPQANDSAVLLLPYTTKTKGKRICPPTFKTPISKAICRSLQHPRPTRKMQVPLLARRPSYIFPPTSKAKHVCAEESETSTPKRLHKEEDNQALYMHFASHDHDCQPMPRIRLGPNNVSQQSFLRVKLDKVRAFANSREMSETQAAQSDIHCMDIDTNHDPRPTVQAIRAIGDTMEIELYQDPQPVPPAVFYPIAILDGPDEHDDIFSEIQHSEVETIGPREESNQKKHSKSPLPAVHRRRRFAHIKGTSNRVREDLETFTIDGDAMVGLVCYPSTEPGVLSWFSTALSTSVFTGRDALSYFRRLIGNFMDRPPRPCRHDPCSAWGLLSV